MAALSRVLSSPRTAIGLALLAIVVLAYLGWAIYVAATDGVEDGIGVAVSIPALLVIAALVVAPFAAAVWLTMRLISAMRNGDGSGGGAETITTKTFPC